MTYTLDDFRRSYETMNLSREKDSFKWCSTLLAVLRSAEQNLNIDIPENKELIIWEMSAYGKEVCRENGYYELFWEYLLFEAPYVFDSYLIYLERNRIRQNMFYVPKRKQFLKLGLIQAMQDLEDDKLDLLTISLPPGTGKTTLEKFFTTWVMGRHPEDYSLFFSHSGDITRMFYDGVLDILTNDTEYCWHKIFPKCTIERTNAKKEQINLNLFKPFPTLQTTSVGSNNAGKVRCNRYLFCDDLIGGIEEALSKIRLDKLWNIYSVDARQRKLNEKVKELHIATRWSVHDCIGRLQMAYGDNGRSRFIAIPDIDPETGKSNFDYEFNGMSEQFFHDQELLMDEVSYKCLYKNQPIEREGLLYHEDELRRYLNLPLQDPDAIWGICDTKDKGTDFYAHGCFFQYGDDHYFVDCVFDDGADYGLQYQRSADLIIRNKMQASQFEHNNGGGRVAYEVNELLEKQKYTCNITSKQTTGNKETKIIVNADWVKKHVLFKDKTMYTPRSDYGKCIENLLSYSVAGKNVHDDAPDMFAMYSEFIKKTLNIRPTVIFSSPF